MVNVMVLNVIFNNISVISWRLILLVKETGVPRENHRPVTSHWQTVSHNVVTSTPRHERDLTSPLYIVVIGTKFTGSCKSNYHSKRTTADTLVTKYHIGLIQKFMCSLLQFLVHLFNSIILYVQTYEKYLDVYDIKSIESTRSIFEHCTLTRLL